MTYPPGWNTDYNNFINDATKTQNSFTDYGKDQTAYQANIEAFNQFLKSHTPEEGLLYFFAWIATCTQPQKHDNILGLYDDQTAIFGNQMVVNARSTALTNDIQNLINNTSKLPEDQQVPAALNALKQLINAFETDPRVQSSFDPATISEIVGSLQTFQTTIGQYFVQGGANPPPDPAPTLTSFTDMITKMSEKGDLSGAVEAYKAFTDAGSMLTSTTQNFSAVLNQRVSQVTGMEKNWQSFLGSLMKSMLDEMNSLIQNLAKG